MTRRTIQQLKELDKAAYLVHVRFIELGYYPTCTNCMNFGKTDEVCSKFGVRPPAKVIAISCGDHWDMDIPF